MLLKSEFLEEKLLGEYSTIAFKRGNVTQAFEAAAIILGSEPTPSAIAYRAEQLEMLPQAVSDIRAVLSKPECTWQEFWDVAQEYEVIKQDYWAELTTQETELITALQKGSTEPDIIGLGSIVAHADPALQIVIKKLLAKFPQWGIAIVDKALVN